MIKIVLKTNEVISFYMNIDYTSYSYDGKCFILSKNQELVALFNIDTISFIQKRDIMENNINEKQNE